MGILSDPSIIIIIVMFRSMNQWISALEESSYEKKRAQLINLQIRLRSTTGVDPLGKQGKFH